MRKITTLGLALGLTVGLAGSAAAQIKIGVAGPITGPNAAFGAQLVRHREAIAIAGRRNHPYAGVDGHLERGLAE